MNFENWKSWAPLALAGGLGLVAAAVGYSLVAGGEPQAEVAPVQNIELAQVIAVKEGVGPGDELVAENLIAVDVPPGSVPVSAFASTQQLLENEAGEDAPRVAAQAIYAGQIVVDEALAPTGAAGGLSSVLPEGSRAMNIGIDTFTGLAGFLRPEARVDIVTTLRGGGEPTVVTIAQNIRVLAVNGRMHGEVVQQKSDEDQLSDERVPDSVTLQVTPEQAAAIDLAENQGTPRLVLRSGGDGELSKFAGMTLAELKGDPVARNGDDEFDPYSGETYVGEWDSPVSTTEETGDAEPTTQPGLIETAPANTSKRRPGPHVVEIIRGGISTKEVLPDRRQKRKGQAYAGDGSGDDAFAD